MPELVPVDHDPFAPYQLAPVNHDPFVPQRMVVPNAPVIGNRPDVQQAVKDAAWGAVEPFGKLGKFMTGQSEHWPTDLAGAVAGLAPIGPPGLKGALKPAATAATKAVAKEVGGLGDFINAYHGSPHDFEKFDLSKIGTGEGAQAYGHGLYFAENEGVAKGYKEALAGGNDPMMAMAKDALRRANGDGKLAADQLRSGLFQDRPGVAELADKLASGWKPEGKMYQVAIKASPEHFLDWDKPLGEQHPKVQEILKGIPGRKVTGDSVYDAPYRDRLSVQDFYHTLAKDMVPAEDLRPGFDARSPHAAMNALREAGIPGIKYLDQGSRGKGDGTRNYVVFDDKLIDILKKYGIAGLAALPAAGGHHFRTSEVDHDPFSAAQR
jgi:hypothetical protein